MIATICDIVHVTVSTFVADLCDTTLLRYLPLHSPKANNLLLVCDIFIVDFSTIYFWVGDNLIAAVSTNIVTLAPLAT